MSEMKIFIDITINFLHFRSSGGKDWGGGGKMLVSWSALAFIISLRLFVQYKCIYIFSVHMQCCKIMFYKEMKKKPDEFK